MRRTVLVIGGAGFIGKWVARKFSERGDEVTVLTRRKVALDLLPPVETIVGDRSDEPFLQKSLAGRSFDGVIDLAAYNGEHVESYVDNFAKGTAHYVLCSSGAIYRDYPSWGQGRFVREEEADLTWKGDGAYSEGKRAAELVLWSLPKERRTFPFTIFRPSVVEGPGDTSGRTWYWAQRVADGEPVLVPRTVPSTFFNHSYVEDVAEVMVNSVGNPRVFNQVYNLAGGEILTLEDYVCAIAEAINRGTETVTSPLESIQSEPGLALYQAPFVGEHWVMGVDKAMREIGYTPTGLAKWLRSTVRWFLNEYHGPDSNMYEKRPFEVKAAKRLQGRPLQRI